MNPIHYSSLQIVGIIGILIYSIILFLSIFILLSRKFSKQQYISQVFYLSSILMSLLEYPRFIQFITENQYTSKVAYAFHIISSYLFFTMFTIVCYQWSSLLDLDSYSKSLYNKPSLLIANLAFLCNDLQAIIYLGSTNGSLMDFFESIDYGIYTIIDGIRNLVYSSILTYYGVILISRFWHYSTTYTEWDSQNTLNTLSTNEENEPCPTIKFKFMSKYKTPRKAFMNAVFKITIILSISTICFILRITMLITKLIFLHSTNSITYQNLYSVSWFIFADFIPRSLPMIIIMTLMNKARDNETTDEKSFYEVSESITHDDFVQQKSFTRDSMIIEESKESDKDIPTLVKDLWKRSPSSNSYISTSRESSIDRILEEDLVLSSLHEPLTIQASRYFR